MADLAEVASQALAAAAHRAGLDDRDAQVIRVFATAVYHLPAANAVARIAPVTSPRSVTRLKTSVYVTRWLAATGFPTVEPLDVDQPVLPERRSVHISLPGNCGSGRNDKPLDRITGRDRKSVV